MKIAGKILLLVAFGLSSLIAMEVNSKNEEKKVLKIKVKKQELEKKDLKEEKKSLKKDSLDTKKTEK